MMLFFNFSKLELFDQNFFVVYFETKNSDHETFLERTYLDQISIEFKKVPLLSINFTLLFSVFLGPS